MPRSSSCPFADSNRQCEEPKDKALGDGFCTRHSYLWRQSTEFREAAKDDAVAFSAQLRIPSMLTTALRPHKKRWLKRMSASDEREA